MNEITFQDVARYINNPANYPTRRERDAQRREAERLAARHQAWEADRVAHGLPVDLFAEFEE